MKKVVITGLCFVFAYFAEAQNHILSKRKQRYSDSLKISIEANYLYSGVFIQQITPKALVANYADNLNAKVGTLAFSGGASSAYNAEVGFFFGHKKHFGIGSGIFYLMQNGTLSLSEFHIEYRSTDYQGNVFRQLISATHPINEKLATQNLVIPLMLKYKNRFSRNAGVAVDVGILYQVESKSTYNTDASFDYEAIYQYANVNGSQQIAVYDNSSTPSTTKDWFITRNQYVQSNPNGMTEEFNTLRGQGYNVGLHVAPDKPSGSVLPKEISLGCFLRPQFSFYCSENIAINIGPYLIYQSSKNTSKEPYRLTDKIGEYNALQNDISSAKYQIFGISGGVRISFGKFKDADGDGVPDRKDECPSTPGPKLLHGCPDTDGDGIVDKDDSCPRVKGLPQFHGCPDTDGDGVPDNIDSCPLVHGLPNLHGCPDSDGDGIADKDDSCPHQFGLPKFNGCPDSDGDGIPDKSDACPHTSGIATNYGCPIYIIKFQPNKTLISKNSLPHLDSLISALKANSQFDLLIEKEEIKNSKANKTKEDAAQKEIQVYFSKHGIPSDRLVFGTQKSKTKRKTILTRYDIR